MTLWIVSPMLNDTVSFSRLRLEIAEHFARDQFTDEIRHIVVDDSAGADEDVASLRDLAGVEILTPPFSLGHQGAIVFGLRTISSRVADHDVVVTMDSDGEDQPVDVPRLVRALSEADVPLALAARTERHESLLFRVFYVCFRMVFRLLTGAAVRSGNFAAQRGSSLVTTIAHPSFDLCYSSTLLTLRRPTVKVPCARGVRFAGTSRMNTSSLVAHGVRMLLPFSERVAVRMLTFSGAAFVALLAVVIATFVTEQPGVNLLVSGVACAAMFVTGVVGFVVLFTGFARSHGVAVATRVRSVTE